MQIILSQLNPPAQRSHVLVRERVNQLLLGSLSHQVSILHAGTGYGKTTALLSFIKKHTVQVFWYTVSPTDRDTTVFLANLFTSFSQGDSHFGQEALRIFDLEGTSNLDALIALLNSLAKDLKAESLVIIDDFHHVRDVPEIVRLVDWMVEHLPSHVHILLSTRRSLNLPSINKWKVQNSLLLIEDKDLAFDYQEIADLFASEYTFPLNSAQIYLLFDKTEGWAIGLQMVWQSLRNNPDLGFEKILQDDRDSRKALFAYLAEEVLGRLDSSLQEFLLYTAILTEMDNASCEFLLDQTNCSEILKSLVSTGLFVDELRPGVFRYHHMFREFLLSRIETNPTQVNALHRKIASYFTAHQFWEKAIYHLLKAGDYQHVNLILEAVGDKLIKEGRQESLAYWIDEIPENFRSGLPYIQYLSGEINRYMAQFEKALDQYHAAEQLYEHQGNKIGTSLAIQGQAQIYLDTIRPANAVQPLEDALNLLDPKESPGEVARLMVLLAENQLNLGDPQSAELNLHKARELDTEGEVDVDYIAARLLLRTGRIDEGVRLLKKTDQDLVISDLTRPQRFHRESSVLLSLFYAFKGELDLSEEFAWRGIKVGKNLGSSFVQSVGLMRLGHPTQLNELLTWTGGGYLQAIEMYEEAIRKVEVRRIHVEPLWGICRALGFSGRIVEAREQAKEALAIAALSGDEWISILIRISYGAAELLAGNYHESQSILTEAETMAIKVKDPFTLCAARVWLALNAWQQGFNNSPMVYMKKLLPSIQKHHYEYLLTKVTLLGLSQPSMITPVLLEVRNQGLHTDLVNSLLADLKALAVSYHPGFDLRIQTLGGFSVWRGRKLIERKEWKREKARQLLQLLVARKNNWLTREQITEYLWPEADSETAANNFKVVLNTLNQVLEPSRPSQEKPFFVVRRHTKYGLNPNAQIVIDAEIFEKNVTLLEHNKLAQSVGLYQGRYLENEAMQEWFMSEMQFYHQRFIQAIENLAEDALKRNDVEQAITYLEQLIARDILYEPAYGRLMQIYAQGVNMGMVKQVYQQCQQAMDQQLGTSASDDIQALYHQLIGKDARSQNL